MTRLDTTTERVTLIPEYRDVAGDLVEKNGTWSMSVDSDLPIFMRVVGSEYGISGAEVGMLTGVEQLGDKFRFTLRMTTRSPRIVR